MEVDSRFHSVAYAVCIYGGLMEEEEGKEGTTHLLEHLLLRGTKRRSALQIAELMDELGSNVNAFTDAASLCLYAVVRAQDLPRLMELFSELLLEDGIGDADLELEKEVVKREIEESQDDPGEIVYRCFAEHFWRGTPMAKPLLGDVGSLDRISVSDLKGRLSSLLRASNVRIVAVGKVDEELLLSHAERTYALLPPGGGFSAPTCNPDYGLYYAPSPAAQVYLSLAKRWPSYCDEDFLPSLLINALLGGGMSSRLFRALREERALSYSVDSQVELFWGHSVMTIGSILDRDKLGEALRCLSEVMGSLTEGGLLPGEFERAKAMLIAQAELERDDLSDRLWDIVESDFQLGRATEHSDYVAALAELSVWDAERAIERWIRGKPYLLVLGGNVGIGEGQIDPQILPRV